MPSGADPILALLPEPPDAFEHLPPDVFERLPPAEQAWRGRLFLVLYGAGYPEDMAWWTVLQDEAIEAMQSLRTTMERVTDEMIPAMVEGRVRFDAEITRQAALGGQ